jgi:outer membrane receptor protein involved in Fe transport
VQFQFTSDATQSALFEPRLGINYMLTQQTKLHAFYGRFFMPAPVEDFRASYAATQSVTGPSQCPAGQLCTYDIKAEVDDSFEVGVDQELGSHLLKLSSYYRHGSNALDDQQLLNTNLLQPVNYIESQAYGIDLSVAGKLAPNWSDFLNYSYNISQVRGINGGIFAMPPGQFPIDQFVALDEEQLHTVSSGATWATDQKWCTLQALYGSGFHTGPNNTSGLPGHFTLNSTIGYKFEHDSKFSGFKTSVDVMNIFDNHYVIALQNNFNSNHYAAGREWMVHLAKEF